MTFQQGDKVWNKIKDAVWMGSIIGGGQKKNGERFYVIEGNGMWWIAPAANVRPVGNDYGNATEKATVDQVQAL